ncbi:MAG: TRAP transporter large permease subunit [Deltaproteobacteria bacterium]|nr:TRAP transporter large permease subunit [Deltaproteobacteria bacterium]
MPASSLWEENKLNPEVIAIIMFAGLLLSVFMGFPIAFVLLANAMIFGYVGWGPVVFDLLVSRTYWIMTNDVLVAVPLFVFMGYLLERAAIWDELFDALLLAVGALRGSLALTTTIVCSIFAAATGIVGSELTVMGLMALPAMIKRGYDVRLATGCILASGTLGILIPPSIMLILYGQIAQLSIARLFAGAILPGITLSGLYCIYILIRCYFQPHLGPALPEEERQVPVSKIILGLLKSFVPPIGLIFCVLGSIMFGIAAPTEAASMGAIGGLLLSIAYRKFSFKALTEAVYSALKTTSMVLFVAVGASCFTGVFLRLGGGNIMKDFLLGLPVGPIGLLIVMLLGIFIAGFFIDWIAILLIFIPIIIPIVKELGFDPLWFALIIAVTLQTSFLTPPFAVSIFYLKGVSPPEVTLTDIYKGVPYFIILQIIGLSICIIFPQLVLWLPTRMFG